MTEEYIFEHAEFRWGRDDHSGSEHIIDGLSYAVEVKSIYICFVYSLLFYVLQLSCSLFSFVFTFFFHSS